MTVDTMRRALWSALSAEASRIARREGCSPGYLPGPLWAFASRTFGLGSTSARDLCRDLGFDPDSGETIRERGWEAADAAAEQPP